MNPEVGYVFVTETNALIPLPDFELTAAPAESPRRVVVGDHVIVLPGRSSELDQFSFTLPPMLAVNLGDLVVVADTAGTAYRCRVTLLTAWGTDVRVGGIVTARATATT